METYFAQHRDQIELQLLDGVKELISTFTTRTIYFGDSHGKI